MTLPDFIRVRLTDASGNPVPRSFAIVVLKMPAKNDHRVWVGPSDEDGRVVASRDWLLEEARKDMSFFIMDYLDPSRATGEVAVTAATSAEIEARSPAMNSSNSTSRFVLGGYNSCWPREPLFQLPSA